MYIGQEPATSFTGLIKQDFSVSATTGYTLSHSVNNANDIALFINFVRQEPTTAYSCSGTTLTLTSATASGDDMYCIYLGQALQTINPSSASVGSSQVTPSIITGQTAETSIADDDTVIIHDTSASALRKMTKANFVLGIGGGAYESQLLHVRDEKSANTDGGTFTSGAWQTRTLNTTLTNEITGSSLSSNQIILPAGTYFINSQAPAVKCNAHKLKLRNITDSSDTLIGTQMFTWDGDENSANVQVIGRFTIGAQKTFELQHRGTVTKSTTGFGRLSNFGVVEVYADVQIWKVA